MDLRALDEQGEQLFTSELGKARDELARLYLPLADYLARRFTGRGEPLEDLVQVASLGLLKAIDRYDPERGVRFTTYAIPTIVGEIKRYFRDSCWAIRVPRRVQEIGLRLREVVTALTQELGRSPAVSEIAERLAISQEQVLEALDATHCYSVGSLDAAMFDGETATTLEARLGAPDAGIELLESWANVEPFVRRLPEREQLILSLRFTRGLTQTEIAERVGISQMHVSRLLARTIERLRAALTDEETELVGA